jgi:hypothetical protein
MTLALPAVGPEIRDLGGAAPQRRQPPTKTERAARDHGFAVKTASACSSTVNSSRPT